MIRHPSVEPADVPMRTRFRVAVFVGNFALAGYAIAIASPDSRQAPASTFFLAVALGAVLGALGAKALFPDAQRLYGRLLAPATLIGFFAGGSSSPFSSPLQVIIWVAFCTYVAALLATFPTRPSPQPIRQSLSSGLRTALLLLLTLIFLAVLVPVLLRR